MRFAHRGDIVGMGGRRADVDFEAAVPHCSRYFSQEGVIRQKNSEVLVWLDNVILGVAIQVLAPTGFIDQ